jgi:catechol 2,3-dioxygenase-like lactoylglutathione lyase family enzyme
MFLSQRDEPRIVRLDHIKITIPVGAEESGRAFYCDILNLQEMEKPESLRGRGGFWLQVGDLPVHISTEDDVNREATKMHLAYQATDLASWRTRLEEMGMAIKESVPIPGFDCFEIRDPFGNRIEIIQEYEFY